jgi:dipeptidyl aminopeptidase/acylaminoacyl peptidase
MDMETAMLSLRSSLLLLIIIGCAAFVVAQNAPQPAGPAPSIDAEDLYHEMLSTQKAVDDLLWYQKVGDVAVVDKIRITSTRPIRMANPTGQGAGNPLIIYAYTFVPKKLAAGHKAPLIVFVHGGVHADFDSSYAHIVRELMDQGYVVVAPEYRGSTGFGKEFYDQIDYGGAEIDDTHTARDWAVQNMSQVDPERVGIMGWSHGGYHTLLNIARWPKDYKVAYAGCPVSDLVMRMGYKGPGYSQEFAGFIGKSAANDPMEYRRRSPVFHAAEIQTPLLLHTNTNDEDVNVMEVQHMIEALKAAGKNFEYKIYQDAPGGHQFNRIDTPLARQSRQEIYEFLAKYLK